MNHESGQTVVDLLVASALLVVLVALAGMALAVTDTATGTVVAEAASETRARDTLDAVARAIRAARPVGWCPSAPPSAQFTTPASHCLHIADYEGLPTGALVPGGPVLYVDTRQIWFWSEPPANTDPLAVPDCEQLEASSDGRVLVNRWSGAGTFTDVSCPGVTFASSGPPIASAPPHTAELIGVLARGGGGMIAPSDANGDPPEAPERTILVRIEPTFAFRFGLDATRTVTVPVEAAVSGAVYEGEQAWDG